MIACTSDGMLISSHGHTCLPRPTSRLSFEPRAVRVRKVLPALGIAVEGGSDTPTASLPRIIAVQPFGAAFQAGGLRVGQLLQEVDGISLSG